MNPFGLFEGIFELLDRKYPNLGEGKKMNFLKKLGSIVVRIIDAITNMNLLPLLSGALSTAGSGVASAVTKTVDRLTAALHAVITAEQMFKAAGQEKAGSAKLKAVTPFIAALVHDAIAELKPGAKPKDEAAFEDACTRATAALADALNAYGD